MKNIFFITVTLILTTPLSQAACVLSVSGGFNSVFVIQNYFSEYSPPLKAGWSAHWDPTHSGDADIEFSKSKSYDFAAGIVVSEEAVLVVDKNQIALHAKGRGWMSRGETCGQQSLGKAYQYAIKRMIRQINTQLPECSR